MNLMVTPYLIGTKIYYSYFSDKFAQSDNEIFFLFHSDDRTFNFEFEFKDCIITKHKLFFFYFFDELYSVYSLCLSDAI